MKATYRLTTKTQYEFVELETDEGTVAVPDEVREQALEEYEKLTKTFKGEATGFGIEDKEFNKVVDELLTTNKITGDPGMLEEMSKEQNTIVQAIKRSYKRTH